MAKTKVFKGIINGQEFDNVQAYNTRMNELIASGEDIEATSQTSIQDVEDVCTEENENDCSKGTNTGEEFVNMLPGFNPRTALNSFLNELVTENPNLDEENFAKVRKYHEENYPKMVDKIERMDYHAAKGYLNDINVVLTEITNADSDVKKSDNDIRTQIASLEEQLKDVERCYRVIKEYRDLYQELKSRVVNRINHLNRNTSNEEKFEKPITNVFDGLLTRNPEKVDVRGILKLLSEVLGIDGSPFGGKPTEIK